MENIVLIGFMGTGKSRIAKALKQNYGYETMEMDQVIERREGLNIPKIFEIHGEKYFRDCETQLLRELSARTDTVISSGGGTPLREENVTLLKGIGKVVFLSSSPETIYHRVKDSHNRPLLENNKSVEFIESLLTERMPKYTRAADFTVETDGKTPEEIAKNIMEIINGEKA